MSCTGIHVIDPVCQVTAAATSATSAVADSAFSRIAAYFGAATATATAWLWQQIDQATSLDLTSPGLATQLSATAAVAGGLCLALFLIQVITSVLRGQPSGLGRAFSGLIVSFVGSAIALAATRVLIGAVDALSNGFVAYTMHTNISGLGKRMSFFWVTQIQNPVIIVLLSLVILAAVVIVWAAMMLRKLMILVAAVLAPLAFSGATADITRSWVRRWIEFVAAMIAAKLLLVIIFCVGIAVLDGAGQTSSGFTQATTQAAGGVIVLLLAGLAPWVAVRMFHFAGDTLHAAHATAGQATAGAQTAIAAPQKVAALQSQSRALTGASHRSGGGSMAGGTPSRLPASRTAPTPTGASPGANRAGAAGVASSGGAAAASAAAAPAILFTGAATALKAAKNASVSAVQSAQDSASPGEARSTPPPTRQPPTRQPPPSA